jgi:hypothetical protein
MQTCELWVESPGGQQKEPNRVKQGNACLLTNDSIKLIVSRREAESEIQFYAYQYFYEISPYFSVTDDFSQYNLVLIMISMPASYSGDPGFGSRPGDWLI